MNNKIPVCKQCKYHKTVGWGAWDVCKHYSSNSPITGTRYELCELVRCEGGPCGIEGVSYEPKWSYKVISYLENKFFFIRLLRIGTKND